MHRSIRRYLPRSLRVAFDRFLGRQADYYVVSFPKSGRTWLRLLLDRTITRHLGIDPTPSSPFENKHRRVAGIRVPVIRFSHDNSNKALDAQPAPSPSFFRDRHVILLVRDPRDVVVSYFHHRTRRMGERHHLSSFIRDPSWGATRCIDFLAHWAQNRGIPKSFLLVRYEDLTEDAGAVLRQILSWCRLPEIADDIVEEAVQYTSFENLRRLSVTDLSKYSSLAPRNPNNEDSFKFRKGLVGGYLEELSAEDIAWIESVMVERLPECFGYRPNKGRS